MLQEWKSGVAIEEVSFDRITIWIQIYRLSREYMMMRNIKMIGDRLGTVVAVENPFADGLGRGFARVRVSLDIEKPLATHVKVNRVSGESCKLDLKYERL